MADAGTSDTVSVTDCGFDSETNGNIIPLSNIAFSDDGSNAAFIAAACPTSGPSIDLTQGLSSVQDLSFVLVRVNGLGTPTMSVAVQPIVQTQDSGYTPVLNPGRQALYSTLIGKPRNYGGADSLNASITSGSESD